MQAFRFTKIESGEKILFGPHASSSQSELSVHRANQPSYATHTRLRIVCVTDRRLIIESGDSAITIPTHEIQTVVIKRKPGKRSPRRFDLVRAKSKNGRRIQLDIPDVEGRRESRLKTAFPNAEIKESKGLSGFLDKILGD